MGHHSCDHLVCFECVGSQKSCPCLAKKLDLVFGTSKKDVKAVWKTDCAYARGTLYTDCRKFVLGGDLLDYQ